MRSLFFFRLRLLATTRSMEEEESEAEILPLGKGTDHSLLELLVEVCLHNHYICFSHGDATVTYLIVLLLHRYIVCNDVATVH